MALITSDHVPVRKREDARKAQLQAQQAQQAQLAQQEEQRRQQQSVGNFVATAAAPTVSPISNPSSSQSAGPATIGPPSSSSSGGGGGGGGSGGGGSMGAGGSGGMGSTPSAVTSLTELESDGDRHYPASDAKQEAEMLHMAFKSGVPMPTGAALKRRSALSNLPACHLFGCAGVPMPTDADRPKQHGIQRTQVTTPSYFPQQPILRMDAGFVEKKLETDTLFFIFYQQQGSYQQYLAARELKKQSWRYHKKYLTWFQRHEEPKVTTEDYEQGTYVYFDYDKEWDKQIRCQTPLPPVPHTTVPHTIVPARPQKNTTHMNTQIRSQHRVLLPCVGRLCVAARTRVLLVESVWIAMMGMMEMMEMMDMALVNSPAPATTAAGAISPSNTPSWKSRRSEGIVCVYTFYVRAPFRVCTSKLLRPGGGRAEAGRRVCEVARVSSRC